MKWKALKNIILQYNNYIASDELQKLDNYYLKSDLKYIYKKNRDKIIILLNTIENIWKTREITAQNFETLFLGLRSTWNVIYFYILGKQINLMIGKIYGVENLFYKGIEDNNWTTRLNTVVIMKEIDNKIIKNKITEIGLQDKSKKVREMAIDVKNNY